jgi:SAM-dependent methyltransferase
LPFADRAFGGAISMFTSLGYFAAESDHQAAFAEAARVLTVGGFLLIDYLNAQAVIADPGRDTSREIGEYEVREERRLVAGASRIEKRVTVRRRTAPAGEPVKEYVESVALWSRAELETRLRRAGFEVRSVTGNYQGASFGPAAPRLIVLCTRGGVG